MSNVEINKALQTIGLTEYEATAYLVLTQIGTSNAGTLSKISEIPHSKIYEVLSRLEKKKLIEVQKGRPLYFKANKPSISLDAIKTDLITKLRQELTQRKSSLDSLYEEKLSQISQTQNVLSELNNFYEKNASIEPSEEFIWTIRGKENIISQAKEAIQAALSEVRLMMPLDDFSELISTIKTVSSKGIKVQLIIHELTASVEKLKGSTTIFYDESPLPTNCGMVLSDQKKGMFISENSTIGFKASSKSVLMVLAQFYQHEVEESVKLKL